MTSTKRKNPPKGPFWKFLICDLFVIIVSLFLAFYIHFREIRVENIIIYYELMFLIILTRIGSLFLFRLYDFSKRLFTFDIVYFTALAMVMAHSIELLAILYAVVFYKIPLFFDFLPGSREDQAQISRYVIVLNFFLSWMGTATWRILYLKRRQRWAYDQTRIVIVGTGELAESVQKDIHEYSRLGHKVVGLIDDDIEGSPNDSPVLGKMQDLERVIEEKDIDEIIVTSRLANRRELLNIISKCQLTGCKIRLLPELYEVTIGQVEVEQVGGVPLITVHPKQINQFGLTGKRIVDVVLSILALLILLPLLPFIALAIRLTSRGPIIYRQQRYGKDSNIFTLYKFRTMQVDAESKLGPILSWEKDPRVTRVGKILRKWHLDEVPQFVNVIIGDMSLVGPRPERPHFAQIYYNEIPAYRLRDSIRPGMTGLAQIHGFYNSPIEHKLRYDLAYINNMSFLLDIKILFLTLRMIFTGRESL